MAAGVLCEACGVEAPCRQVQFDQNIGALVIRFGKKYRGEMCKRCVHKYYWKTTGVNLSVGWLGYISLFVAPIFTIANTVRYIGALKLPPVPPGAKPPQLTEDAVKKLTPLREELIQRLNAREPFATVAADIAARGGVTPGTVVLYVRALARPPQPQPPTGGFPVLPPKQAAPALGTPSPIAAPPPLPVLPAEPRQSIEQPALGISSVE